MTDQETMNRAFAQAIATGTSTIMVSVPNRAGKSTLHRQIQQFMKSTKPIESELSSDMNVNWHSRSDNPWFEPIESRYDITVDEAERLKAAFDESMMDSIKNQDWRGQSK